MSRVKTDGDHINVLTLDEFDMNTESERNEGTALEESVDGDIVYNMQDPERPHLCEWLERYTPGKTNQ